MDGSQDIDILIVDTNSDLNVYVDMAKDDSKSRDEPASCCVSSASACGPSKLKGNSTLELNLSDIDINEWVGKFSGFSLFDAFLYT
jgi:arsenite methyltransferase